MLTHLLLTISPLSLCLLMFEEQETGTLHKDTGENNLDSIGR